MVNVNKNQLKDSELNKLLHQFDCTLTRLDRISTSLFLDELLGNEERLTLAKRIAAIVLLCEGYSEYRVSKVLKLSPTTTGIISTKIKSGSYNGIIELLQKKKKNYLSLLKSIDSILHLGGILPHRVGRDRYRGI